MKYKLLTILLFFCIQQNLHSIDVGVKMKNEKDSTFLLLIKPYCRTDFPLYCTDLDYEDNTDELDPTNFELQMKYLVNIFAISKLSKFLVYVDGNIVGSSYAINKLRAFKRPGTSNFVLLFYIKGSWDLSRSLVYAVLDSSGKEVFSQVLVTEDPTIEDNPQDIYKQTLCKIDESHIEISLFRSTNSYGDLKAERDYFYYQINEDGSLTLQQTDHNIKD